MARHAHDHPPSNLDVDYVICYRIPNADKEGAVAQFKKLIRSLGEVGLQTEVRTNDETSILVFVKVADEKFLGDVVYRSRQVEPAIANMHKALTVRIELRTGSMAFAKSSLPKLNNRPQSSPPSL